MQESHVRQTFERPILLVEDDPVFRANVRKVLGQAYRLDAASSEDEFRGLYRPHVYALVILDMRLKVGREGLDLLREIQALDEFQPTIVVSAYGDTEATIEALEAGALMFLNKAEFTPGLVARVVEALMQQARIRRRIAILEGQLYSDLPLDLIGRSPGILETARKLQDAAGDPTSTVVLFGEPGTGRRLAARLIHSRSPRRSQGSFVELGSRVLEDRVAETLIFGGDAGTLPVRRKGLLERAHDGALFLEELTSYTHPVIVRLLQAMREKALHLPGASRPFPVDAQFLSAVAPDKATTTSFVRSVRRAMPGSRLIEVYLPPLRERTDDLPLLVPSFVQDFRRRGAAFARPVSHEVVERLLSYRWPGNLRELQTVIEYAQIRAATAGCAEVLLKHLPSLMSDESAANTTPLAAADYRQQVARAELELVERTLLLSGKARTKAALAELLGYNDRFTLQRRLRRHLSTFPQLASGFPNVAGAFGPAANH